MSMLDSEAARFARKSEELVESVKNKIAATQVGGCRQFSSLEQIFNSAAFGQ